MFLPMSLKGGLDSRGFVAGALEGAKDNMKAFNDRYSSLKDKYATGKEKREREGMDIRDKQQADIFDMYDKFNARKQKIDSQMFRLKSQNDKLIATTGQSKETEMNAVKHSDLAMEAEALGLDAASTKASNKSPSEQEKIMVQHIKDKYGFMLGADGKSLFINKQAISEDDPRFQDMLKDVEAATTKFYSILRATGNTSYPTQVDARLQVLGKIPNIGFRVTSPTVP